MNKKFINIGILLRVKTQACYSFDSEERKESLIATKRRSKEYTKLPRVSLWITVHIFLCSCNFVAETMLRSLTTSNVWDIIDLWLIRITCIARLNWWLRHPIILMPVCLENIRLAVQLSPMRHTTVCRNLLKTESTISMNWGLALASSVRSSSKGEKQSRLFR